MSAVQIWRLFLEDYDLETFLVYLPVNLAIALIIFIAIWSRKKWFARSTACLGAFCASAWLYLILAFLPWFVSWSFKWFIEAESWLYSEPGRNTFRGSIALDMNYYNPMHLNTYTLRSLSTFFQVYSSIIFILLIVSLTITIATSISSRWFTKPRNLIWSTLIILVLVYTRLIMQPLILYMLIYAFVGLVITGISGRRFPKLVQVSGGILAGLIVGGFAHFVTVIIADPPSDPLLLQNSVIVVALVLIACLLVWITSLGRKLIKDRAKA